MLRLNKLTDYAVVILAQMARDGTRRHATSSLAEQTGVPEPTVAKLMKDLLRAGLVQSSRGAMGGYTLRGGDAPTVRAIIEAVEGPIALTDCIDGHKTGCAAQGCQVRGSWDMVNDAIIAALDAVTLKDMMQTPAVVQHTLHQPVIPTAREESGRDFSLHSK